MTHTGDVALETTTKTALVRQHSQSNQPLIEWHGAHLNGITAIIFKIKAPSLQLLQLEPEILAPRYI